MWRSYRGAEPSGVAPPRSNQHQVSLLSVVGGDSALPEERRVTALVASTAPMVAIFWLEKVLIVLDFLQIMGLLWITSQPWPWPPYPFVVGTRFTVYANLDFFSAAETGALVGASGNISIPKWGMKMGGYVSYSLAFLFSQFGVVLLYLAFCWGVFPAWARRWNRFKPPALAALLFLLYILYLPVGIAVFRLYYCEESSGPSGSLSSFPAGVSYLSADPSLQCWTGSHLACVILSIFFHGPVLLGLPLVMRSFVRDAVVYHDPRDHEKRLQAWELGSLLGVDRRHWLTGNIWLCGSFTLHAAHLHVHCTVLKALLLLLSVFVRHNYKSQAAAMWWSVLLFCLYYGFYCLRCYRVDSSNAIHKTTVMLMLANFSLAAVNSSGLRNAVTVASNQALLLLVVNAAGVLFVLCILALVSLNSLSPSHTQHPVMRTLLRLSNSTLLQPLALRWAADLRLTLGLLDGLAAVPAEVTDPRVLDGCILTLRRDWLLARSYASIFQLLLHDAIEDALVLRAVREPLLFRENESWDRAYQQATAHSTYSRRRSHLLLMSPRKRRIVNKLLALRLFQQRFHYESSGVADPASIEDLEDEFLGDDSQGAMASKVLHELEKEFGDANEAEAGSWGRGDVSKKD